MHIPHPIHKPSLITQIPDFFVTSIQFFPALLTGHAFLHSNTQR